MGHLFILLYNNPLFVQDFVRSEPISDLSVW